jgi:hypothetical protein
MKNFYRRLGEHKPPFLKLFQEMKILKVISLIQLLSKGATIYKRREKLHQVDKVLEG